MTNCWIFIILLIIRMTLEQSDFRYNQKYYCLTPGETEDIEQKVNCSISTDIIQIIDIHYACANDCNSPEYEPSVTLPNKNIKSVFSRICNGKNVCKFGGGDTVHTLRSYMSDICHDTPAIIFRVAIRCSEEWKMINICQDPPEEIETYTHTPYIYSINYPDVLPNDILACECVLSGSQPGYFPYIDALLMQFRGQNTKDEQIIMEFMSSNGTTKKMSYYFVAYNDSASQSGINTIYDLTQSMIVMDTFTRWMSIRLTIRKHHSARSAGRYMFMFGKTTKVKCSTTDIEKVTGRDTTTGHTITAVQGDATGHEHSGHTSQAMRTHDQTTMISTSILTTSDTDISLNGQSEFSTDVLDVTTLPSLIKSRQKSSYASKNLGALFGSVAAGLVICVTTFLISCIIYNKRNKKKAEGHSRASDISFKNFSVEVEDINNIALSVRLDHIASSIKTKCTTDIPLDDVSRTRNSQKSASIHIKPEEDKLDEVGENNGVKIETEDVEVFQRNSAYVSADALSLNDSPLLQHMNSVCASAEVSQENDVSVISSPDSAMTASIDNERENTCELENNSQTHNNNKEMNTSQSNDEVLSVTAPKTNESYLDENNYNLYYDSHRKLDLPKTNEQNKVYDEAIPVSKEADATAVYTTEPVSRAMIVDSIKVRPLDRRDLPDYTYAYAKTRGDYSFKVDGSSPDDASNAYTYIKTSDENMTRKPDVVVGPSTNEQPYSYADLRGRVVRGITEHIRVPGYDFEQMEKNTGCDMEQNMKNNEYDLEQNVENTEYDLEQNVNHTDYGMEQNAKDTEYDPKQNVKHTEYEMEQNV